MTAPKEKMRLTGVEETCFSMVWVKSLDAANESPILADPYSQGLLDRVELDYTRSTLNTRDQRYVRYVAKRCKQFDDWVREFIESQPDEPLTIVHMACGLDCRALRLAGSMRPDVRWIDLDRPMVVNLREKLIQHPSAGEYYLRTLDVGDERWLMDIPADRRTLIVMEGLSMYLAPGTVRHLIGGVVGYFGRGELLLDTVSSLFVRWTDHVEFLRSAGAKFTFGVDDAVEELESLDPKLKLVSRVMMREYMGYASFGQYSPPWFGYGLVGKLKIAIASLFPSFHLFGQHLRFVFGE